MKLWYLDLCKIVFSTNLAQSIVNLIGYITVDYLLIDFKVQSNYSNHIVFHMVRDRGYAQNRRHLRMRI